MRRAITLSAFALVLAGLPVASASLSAPVAGAAGGTRQISASGTAHLVPLASGSDAVQFPEIRGEEDDDAGPAAGTGPIVDRSSGKPGHGGPGQDHKKAKSNPELKTSFDGLNFRQQRLANGGNQFSVEPPDQGLCVGNGFEMETVNDVIRVYNSAGTPLSDPVDQNTFYGYPPAITRPAGPFGEFVTDPSCWYDGTTQRWFHVVLTLDVDPATGDFTGTNHLDLAVSKTSSPLGAWTIYRTPVQDDGTDGTPNHHCSLGPCIGDYPHIGADTNGFYITTNEYSFNGPEFKAAQIYAFSKAALAANASNVTVTQIDTSGMGFNGQPGFTVWPSTSPNGSAKGGTEFFMSSDAAEEASGVAGGTTSTRLLVWTLANTASLNSTPALQLSNKVLPVGLYATPPKSVQKTGDFPLGQCINDTTAPTPFGPGCWQFLFNDEPAHNEVISPLDSNDTRMQQVWYANGKLWGALDTAVTVGGENRAGIEWFIVNPSAGKVDLTGYLAMENNNVDYPAIATTASGRGVMAFTLVGEDHHPTAAYASIDAKVGVGDIHVAAEGAGVQDGFSGYKAFNDPTRPRWGDYGAAQVDGNSIWIASEYIGQTCTLAQYMATPFGSCGGTRASLGNWDTRISKLTP